jgi:hypothetical protein
MPPPEDAQHSPVAVQVALLTGKIDQVISDHERRLAALETRAGAGATRAAAVAGPWIAGAGLAVVIIMKVPWT